MSESDLAIVAALVFAWGTLSARLERFDVTAPIIFVLAGVLLTHGPLAVLSFTPTAELVKALAEVTLVLVLFSDASRVGLRELRADAGLYARLLGIGLPLTIGLGTLLVWLSFGAVAVAAALQSLTWQIVVYAVLSLTVIRPACPMYPSAGASAGRPPQRQGPARIRAAGTRDQPAPGSGR